MKVWFFFFDLTLHLLVVPFLQNMSGVSEPPGEALEKQRLGGLSWGNHECPGGVLGLLADER